jgi:hypothetical protein
MISALKTYLPRVHIFGSPELVREYLKNSKPFEAPAKYLDFKRWDRLVENDNPAVVIFFASYDVLSGLFTLANYDWSDPCGVIAPMGAGCSSIIYYPLEEVDLEKPRCILGMFDVSGCSRKILLVKNLFLFLHPSSVILLVQNYHAQFRITLDLTYMGT